MVGPGQGQGDQGSVDRTKRVAIRYSRTILGDWTVTARGWLEDGVSYCIVHESSSPRKRGTTLARLNMGLRSRGDDDVKRGGRGRPMHDASSDPVRLHRRRRAR